MLRRYSSRFLTLFGRRLFTASSNTLFWRMWGSVSMKLTTSSLNLKASFMCFALSWRDLQICLEFSIRCITAWKKQDPSPGTLSGHQKFTCKIFVRTWLMYSFEVHWPDLNLSSEIFPPPEMCLTLPWGDGEPIFMSCNKSVTFSSGPCDMLWILIKSNCSVNSVNGCECSEVQLWCGIPLVVLDAMQSCKEKNRILEELTTNRRASTNRQSYWAIYV